MVDGTKLSVGVCRGSFGKVKQRQYYIEQVLPAWPSGYIAAFYACDTCQGDGSIQPNGFC